MLRRYFERSNKKLKKLVIYLMAACMCPLAPGGVSAWGPTGHAVIGQAALDRLSPPARAEALSILGVAPGQDADSALDRACNWPDEVRETPEWAWSAPLHYVNLPRSDPRYDRQRDCPDGLCVTEGILRYAAVLGRPEANRPPSGHLEDSARWQAFAWVCHLVGDLHQPLHAGFRDDRGGNLVEVEYRGERWNLHEFWDGVLTRERWSAGDRLPASAGPTGTGFEPTEPACWTEESHRYAVEVAYPPCETISTEFADRSWSLILERWSDAAERLARVLEQALAPAGG